MSCALYIDIVKKNFTRVFLVSFFVSVLAMGIISKIPPKYIALGSLLVDSKTPPQAERFFSYEGFYGQKVAESYADSAKAILQSYDFAYSYLRENKKDTSFKSVKKVNRSIKVTKKSSQVFLVSISATSPNRAKSIWNYSTHFLEDRFNEINEKFNRNVVVISLLEEPLVTQKKVPVYLGGIVFFFAAFFGSFFLVWAVKELRNG